MRADMDFGERLRQAREKRGITLRQISANTKISHGVLEALERNDVSRLPGGIFTRSFVRSYAIEIGLDPDQALREFLQRFPSEVDRTPGTDTAHETQFESQRQAAVLLAALAVASVVIVVAFLLLTRGSSTAPVAATPAPSAESGVRPAPSTGSVARDEASALGNERSEGLTVTIRPTGSCWVSVSIDGGPAMQRLMAGGDREVHRARNDIDLELGDAAACAFTINGLPTKTMGRAGEVVRLGISLDNYKQFLRD